MIPRNEILIQGQGWIVRNAAGGPGVFSDIEDGSHLEATRRCADQAHAGIELAITAVLMCENDAVLQRYMRDRFYEWK